MRLFALVCLFVAGLGTATDISDFFGRGCSGNRLLYRDVAQKTCASAIHNKGDKTYGAKSIGFGHKPSAALGIGWYLSKKGARCGKVANEGGNGKPSVCLEVAQGAMYAGASWQRLSSKRDVASPECTGPANPTSIIFENGPEYNVTSMDSDDYATLYVLAAEGAPISSIPARFSQYEI